MAFSRSERLRKKSFSLRGQKKMMDNLNKLVNELGPDSYGGAMGRMVRSVQTTAMDLTPVDTGYLRSTARGKVVKADSQGAEGVVYYTAPYAAPVHKRTPYLARAVATEAPVMAEKLGHSLRINMFNKDMA
jgi:hypothetical protein